MRNRLSTINCIKIVLYKKLATAVYTSYLCRLYIQNRLMVIKWTIKLECAKPMSTDSSIIEINLRHCQLWKEKFRHYT